MNKLCIAALVCAFAGTAMADHDRGFFIGAFGAYISNEVLVSDRADQNEVGHPAIELVAGYKFSPWLGVDIRYGDATTERSLSAIPDIANPAAGRFEYRIDSYQSVYYRPEITNREAKLYLLLGYTQLDAQVEEFVADGGGETRVNVVDYSESGLAYGIGAGWFVDDFFTINAEYRMLLDEDENEFSIITLGADYRF